jgi:uncharacterized alkaline shock family protein YloU
LVDTKSKDDIGTAGARLTDGLSKMYDAVDENLTRTIDELVKLQPKYGQSISSLQLDAANTVKNIIHNTTSGQKQFASGWSIPIPYTEEVVKQSKEITKNIINAIGISNQLATNSLDTIIENCRIFNQTIDSVTEFSSNAAKMWNSFCSAQQQ